MIDVLTVKISDPLNTGEVLKFLDATDTDDFLTVVGDPHRDRVAPVSVSGEAPVFSIN
jgi:hypothetical protein